MSTQIKKEGQMIKILGTFISLIFHYSYNKPVSWAIMEISTSLWEFLNTNWNKYSYFKINAL